MRRSPMQVTVENLMEKAGLTKAYNKALDNWYNRYGCHLSVELEHFDKLVIEVVGKNQVSVAHYYTQNGDAMRDPEIVFVLPYWKVIEYRNDGLGIYQRASEGNHIPGATSFARKWAVNIREQGFEKGKFHSLTHDIRPKQIRIRVDGEGNLQVALTDQIIKDKARSDDISYAAYAWQYLIARGEEITGNELAERIERDYEGSPRIAAICEALRY